MSVQEEEYLKKAKFQYDAAFHLLHVTMPVVQEPKLMLGILNNLFSSLDSALDAILTHERSMRLSPAYHNTFNGKMTNFSQKTVKRYKLSPKYVELITSIKETLDFYKQSPIEFPREDKFIICNRDYQYHSLTIKDLKVQLDQTKEFLDIITDIINNKRITGESDK